MKRGLIFALCAFAATAMSTLASAQTVDLSLNLRYTDPNNPSAGGRWFLLAKASAGNGIAGISVYANDITTTMEFGNSTAVGAGAAEYAVLGPDVTGSNVETVGGLPYSNTFDGAVNFVYGQDLANGPIVANVGEAGGPGDYGNDPLQNSDWDNAALISSGAFGAVRPTIATNVGAEGSFLGNNTDANFLGHPSDLNVDAGAAATTIVVRGDAVIADGLAKGDANRDWMVSFGDYTALLTNYGGAGGWNEGDSNSDGQVSFGDYTALLTAYGTSQTPPAMVSMAPVPEPATVCLALLAAAAGVGMARRRG